ncbi:CD9 antigen [Echinococcus granulosus]|uniref:Tetraspanin n=1 Tax=Echinococcus granulosus TaxID=6210 RepID=U6JEW1_ECHGR|nr:CD9 antigen [Echinococcus granulosus]EUB55617.1 CD9 antigen [Echinococcus granulosus]KAH9285939.1 CD9 antigen [Echinococcus granulosus]CDS22589.1 tetraspanin [Echinococcus granulosus]
MAKVSVTGCFKCVKYALFAFCLVAWIIGLVAFVWGIVARATGHFGPLESHIPAATSGANILIAVGFIIMFVGFLGCCGAIRESQFLLMAFFFSIFLCFSLLMAAGLWAVAWQPRLPVYLHNSLEKLVRSYKTDSNSDDIKLLDFIQNKFACCGAVGIEDFSGLHVPASCGSTITEQTQRPGCQPKILQSGQENLSTMAGIGIGFGVIMICGMVFSLMLCCALREIN